MQKYEILSYLVGLTSGIVIMLLINLFKLLRGDKNVWYTKNKWRWY